MESREDYKNFRDELKDFFSSYETFFTHVCQGEESLMENYKRRIATFSIRQEQIDKQSFTVVVIGEMKHGKSTLLNALLGEPAFPKDVREATATVSYLRHNNTAPNPEWRNKAVVTFWDENRKPVVKEHTELMEYTTCLGNTLNVSEEVKEVSIYTDSPFVEDGVTVVDTPGTNTTVEKHEDITNDQIDKSNAAIFLFKAGMPGKKSDYEFLADAASKINKFFFVVNRIDETGGLEKAEIPLEDIRKKMREIPELADLEKSKFYPTSGLFALLGRYGFVDNEKYTKDEWQDLDKPEFREKLLKRSGVPVFEDALLTYLFKGERMADFFRSHLKYLEECLKGDQILLKDRRDSLEGKTDLKDLEQRKAELELAQEKQKAKIEATSNDLNEKLGNALREFQEEATAKIECTQSKFENELNEYTELTALESNWEELSSRPAKIYTRMRNALLDTMQDTVKDVFRGQDKKLRGQLNTSLKEAGVMNLPNISDSFVRKPTITKGFAPAEMLERAEKLKKQLEELNQQLMNSSAAEAQWENLQEKKASLEKEIQRTETTAANRAAMLGNRPGPQIVTIPGYDSEEDREGLGYCFQWLIGPKTVHHSPRIEKDDSAQKAYDAEQKAIQEWQEKKKKELDNRLATLEDQYSKAQIEATKFRELKRLEDRLRVDQQKAQAKLEEELAKAKTGALRQNKRQLLHSLEEACQQLQEDLKTVSGKCAAWADTYISGIQAEVDEFMKNKGAELEALCQNINKKQEEKNLALEQLKQLEDEYQNLRCQFDCLKKTEENYNK